MTKKRLVTHNGSFHADDLFAAATLSLYLDIKGIEYEIVRTRDMEVIKNADYVFDVGGIYDPAVKRFDHHQKGGGGKRENGIPYAAFGLVWKHFGMELCENNKEVWEMIDREIVSPIDANDNGIDLGTLNFKNTKIYPGWRPFVIFEPTWKERENHIDQIFIDQVNKVVELLKREIKVAFDDNECSKIIHNACLNSDYKNKSIIFLEESFPRYMYQEILSSYPEPIYLIYPGLNSGYTVEAINQDPGTFKSRKLFPENWRGMNSVTSDVFKKDNLEGVLFVHGSGFFAKLDTKENAIKFAEKALNYKESFSFAKFFKL
jgi:uncharacterized UPF0160 family protein